MATTMNPVELYHDPSLDGIINQPSSFRRNGSGQGRSNGHERRHSLDSATAPPNRMPPAPEVPRGPPISYRGPVADMPPQRSFSQRAKGRPYAKEAFAEDADIPIRTEPVSRQRVPNEAIANDQHMLPKSRAAPAPDLKLKTQPQEHSKAPVVGGKGRTTKSTQPDPRKTGTSQQDVQPTHTKQPTQVQQNVHARQPVQTRQSSQPQQLAQQTNTQHNSRVVSDSTRLREQAPTSPAMPAGFQTEAYDDNRRDWAPDRSPLQKLEVTLNDISKEEKRARVQEAEMLLRESKAKRGPSGEATTGSRAVEIHHPSQPSVTRRQKEPLADSPTIEDAGLVRNLSSTHRNRLQHSTTIENHRPDTRRLSGEHRGFDYSSQPRDGLYRDLQPAARVVSTGSQPSPAAPSDRPTSSSRQKQPEELYRGASTREPEIQRSAGPGVPSNITRAVSMQNHEPQPQFREDNQFSSDPVQYERNASHKAALAKLTGVAAPVAVPRTGSRKLQKAPPPDLQRDVNREKLPSNYNQPLSSHQRDPRTVNSERAFVAEPRYAQTPPQQITQDVHGNTLRQTSSITSSPMSQRIQSDPTKTRQRKSSVSFKEPAGKGPVDEWKDAKTARLPLVDLSMDRSTGKEGEPYKPWWEQGSGSTKKRRSRAASGSRSGYSQPFDVIDDRTAEFNPRLYVRCGPLLRYCGMKSIPASSDGKTPASEIWRGSVMIVTQDSHSSYNHPPVLRLFSRPKTLLPPPPSHITGEELAPEYVDPIAGLTKVSRIGRPLYVRPIDHLEEEKDLSQIENDDGLFESSPSLLDTNGANAATTAATNKRTSDQDGEGSGAYQEVSGARLYADPDRDVTFWRFNIEVELGNEEQHIVYRINRGAATGFWVPARQQTMNIMFHSCNGFSLSVNPNQFSGPDPLWRDVLNVHQTRPFHVMIGGGDQIYNDRVMTETQHFAAWTQIRNPTHKHNAPFNNEMKEELETFYLNRYAMWFSQGLFGMANSQIPMVNIWDDHDIIDGFGSYPDHFMKSPVFSGVGNVAFKYYMLFQHQSVPEETIAHEPSWILGHEPGQYIHQLSRSLFMHMGKHVAFLGIDCRTERMRDEILSVRSTDLLLERCRKDIVEGETKHLIVLLGVPIAYPRLVWLENVLTSRAMDPIKALGRVGVIKGGFLNKFDGGVEILDDLDDHWTASHHKQERKEFIQDLQDLAAEKSVRITILGGDVHLAAIGQFHSNPKLKIPKDHDHRYMPNIISSAIVNTPPPDMMADIINKRNKNHHLDEYTMENMIPMFTHDVDHKKRNNKHLLPRRNWCSIREYYPGSTPPPTPPETPSILAEDEDIEAQGSSLDDAPKRRFSFTKGVSPGGLIRRLSSRKAPPSSYRDAMDPNAGQQFRSASYDGSQPSRPGMFGQGQNGSGSQTTSFDEPRRRASSFDQASSRPLRPGILRRPTNLSEKAARKGNIPAVDADGNEIDVNDHINLDGGLDIVLNVEVNQKDPAGITAPYRLLVPALWYDGSSDREKLQTGVGVHRKPTLLNRMGIGSKRQTKAAQNQGAGNWGQEMSDAESYSEDENTEKQPPRRRFSLFGNRRPKKVEYYSDEESDLDDDPQTMSQPSQPVQTAQITQPVQQNTMQRQFSPQGPASPNAYNSTYRSAPPPAAPGPQAGHPQAYPASFAQTLTSAAHRVPQNPASAGGYNVPGQQRDALYDTSNRPPANHLPAPASAAPVRRSLTIKSQQPGSQGRSVSDGYTYPKPAASPAAARPAEYQQRSQYQPPPQAQYPAAFNAPPASVAAPQAPAPSEGPPQRRLSKAERMLGITSSGPSHAEPGQQPLHGDGIIGKYQDSDLDRGRNAAPSAYPGESAPMGYSGIDAYKPRRNFSFKKARDWLDGRRAQSEDRNVGGEDMHYSGEDPPTARPGGLKRSGTWQKARDWLDGRKRYEDDYLDDDYTDDEEDLGDPATGMGVHHGGGNVGGRGF